MLAHLFVFLSDQLLSLGQRQHGQGDLCGTLAGKLAIGSGKGDKNQGRSSKWRVQVWVNLVSRRPCHAHEVRGGDQVDGERMSRVLG